MKHAAPLMCAGATVWTVLTTYGLKQGDRVGIQGIGGPGQSPAIHMFASKMGLQRLSPFSQVRLQERGSF